jgi:hypothetical protein
MKTFLDAQSNPNCLGTQMVFLCACVLCETSFRLVRYLWPIIMTEFVDLFLL